MRTCLRLLTLLLILTVGAVRPAHAEGWWDWLAKLSGPGGSSGEGSASLTVYCQPDRADSGLRGEGGGWFNLSGVSERDGQTLEHPPCFFVDYRRYRSPADESWLSVRTEFYEAGVSVRLMPPFEVGFSAGVVQFNSEGVTTTRPSLTVPRLVFKPLLAIPALRDRDRNFGFLQLHFRQSLIVGDLVENDFAPQEGHTFSERHDFVESAGLVLDVVGLVRLLANRDQ